MDRLVLMVVIAFTTNLICHTVDHTNAESVSYKVSYISHYVFVKALCKLISNIFIKASGD